MDLVKQQNQDTITLASLQHTIGSNTFDIKKLKKESADQCLSIKNSLNKHHEAVGHLLENLNKCTGETFTELEDSLEKMNSITNEFYDREYMKCCHSIEENSLIGTDDDNINLSYEDLLDKRINQVETKLQLLK